MPAIPPNPAGEQELTDEQLEQVVGGMMCVTDEDDCKGGHTVSDCQVSPWV